MNPLQRLVRLFIISTIFACNASAVQTPGGNLCDILLNAIQELKAERNHTIGARIALPPRHLIGFTRNSDGKIEAIYSESSNKLSSARHIRGIFSLFGGWNPERIMQKIPVRVTSFPNLKIDSKSNEYSFLPADIRNIFESGQTFVTAGSAEKKTEFSVLMAVAPNPKGNDGRTGILLQNEAPIIVTINGKEYLLEIKGIGTPEGGFDYNYRSTRGTIRGGIEAGSALHEYQMIQLDQQSNPDALEGNAIYGAAVISFESEKGRQATLLRLAPGSIRSNFINNSSLTYDQSTMRELARSFGAVYGNFLARGLIPLSHFENLIALENGQRFIMTDYADISPIGTFPHDSRHAEHAARDALSALSEMPDYKHAEHFPLFKNGLIESLRRFGVLKEGSIHEIEQANSTEAIGEILWDKFLILEYFKQKSRLGWIPAWFKYVNPSSVDFSIAFFSAPIIERFEHSYGRNAVEIYELNETLIKSVKSIEDNVSELKQITTEPGQQEWKKQYKKENPLANDQHAQEALEARRNELEHSKERITEWQAEIKEAT